MGMAVCLYSASTDDRIRRDGAHWLADFLDCQAGFMSIHFSPNKITGANAGGPRQLPIRAHWAARIAQFRRSAYSRILSRLQILVAALTLALVGCHKSRHMICQACQK